MPNLNQNTQIGFMFIHICYLLMSKYRHLKLYGHKCTKISMKIQWLLWLSVGPLQNK
jgi:hypothetical protein